MPYLWNPSELMMHCCERLYEVVCIGIHFCKAKHSDESTIERRILLSSAMSAAVLFRLMGKRAAFTVVVAMIMQRRRTRGQSSNTPHRCTPYSCTFHTGHRPAPQLRPVKHRLSRSRREALSRAGFAAFGRREAIESSRAHRCHHALSSIRSPVA